MLRTAILIASTMLATTAYAATEVTGSCRTDSTGAAIVVAANNQDFVTTTSNVFSDIPGLAVTINTQGAVSDCLIVKFDGAVRTADGTTMGLRAVIDGTILSNPRGIRVASGDHINFETGAALFLF